MRYSCSKGHDSDDSDFCSVCGTRIDSSVMLQPPPPVPISYSSPSSTASQSCPDCSTPYDPLDGKFCGICGYNFETGRSGEMPVDLPPVDLSPVEIPPLLEPIPAPSKPLAPIQTPTSTPVKAQTWSLKIEIDPTLAAPESPPPPVQPEILIPIAPGSANLIGRHSPARAIVPEIALDFDTAVSSRHALLALQPNGALVLRDIGSSNGTQVNATDLVAMQDYPLKDGDRITLGHWTCITVLAS